MQSRALTTTRAVAQVDDTLRAKEAAVTFLASMVKAKVWTVVMREPMRLSVSLATPHATCKSYQRALPATSTSNETELRR
jgi:hypothetical protein